MGSAPRGEAVSLLLLPGPLYQRVFPKAKALVGTRHALYRGMLLDDREHSVPVVA